MYTGEPYCVICKKYIYQLGHTNCILIDRRHYVSPASVTIVYLVATACRANYLRLNLSYALVRELYRTHVYSIGVEADKFVGELRAVDLS